MVCARCGRAGFAGPEIRIAAFGSRFEFLPERESDFGCSGVRGAVRMGNKIGRPPSGARAYNHMSDERKLFRTYLKIKISVPGKA